MPFMVPGKYPASDIFKSVIDTLLVKKNEIHVHFSFEHDTG